MPRDYQPLLISSQSDESHRSPYRLAPEANFGDLCHPTSTESEAQCEIIAVPKNHHLQHPPPNPPIAISTMPEAASADG